MAADTFTATLGLMLMGTGNDNNTWGSNQNTFVFQIVEDAIANALTSTVTGGTLDLSGSPPPAAASQVRYAALLFNGTLVSDQVVQVPNLRKFWWVKNDCVSSFFTLKFKTPAGSASAAIPPGFGYCFVACDGANGITISYFGRPTMTTSVRDSIPAPAEGLSIFNLTTHVPNYYNGTSWVAE